MACEKIDAEKTKTAVATIVSGDQASALCAMIELTRIRFPEEKVKTRLTFIAAGPPALDAGTTTQRDAALAFETLTDFADKPFGSYSALAERQALCGMMAPLPRSYFARQAHYPNWHISQLSPAGERAQCGRDFRVCELMGKCHS
jgi:hypothetical protein